MVQNLGGVVIESINEASSATHVIGGDDSNPFRRTPKLMVALCSTSNILHLDWLIASKRQNRFLETRPYLLLRDRLGEKNYQFNMKETLQNGKMRREEGGILSGWRIYVAKNVAGNKAPKQEDLNVIITSAGGDFLDELNSEIDLSNVIVITSDPDTLPDHVEDQLAEDHVNDAAEVFPTTWLFDVILHQKLSGLKRGR